MNKERGSSRNVNLNEAMIEELNNIISNCIIVKICFYHFSQNAHKIK